MSWIYSDGSGIWANYKNEETGEETVKTHELKVVWKSCKQGEHSYQIVENREMRCSKCGLIATFVPGRDNKFLKENNIN